MDALKTIKEIEKFFNDNEDDSCFEYDNQAHELSWLLDRLEFEKANYERFRKFYDNKSNLELSKSDVDKILDLQEGLLERFKMAHADISTIKKDLEEKVKAGCKTYDSYEIAQIDWWFYFSDEYVIENWGSGGRNGCWNDYICEKVRFALPYNICIYADYPIDDISAKKKHIEYKNKEFSSFENWADEHGLVYKTIQYNANQEFPFFGSCFKDVYLHPFMHMLFDHTKVLTLKDALNMKPDMLSWQVQVNIEARR